MKDSGIVSDSYSDNEDAAFSIEFREATETERRDLLNTTLRIYGPHVYGCKRHEKAVMVSYLPEGEPIWKDIFLDGGQAKNLIEAIDSLKRNYAFKPVLISFDMVLGQRKQGYLLDVQRVKIVFSDIDKIRNAVTAYIEENGEVDIGTEPTRLAPLKESKAPSISAYYKNEPRDIDLEGVDLGSLLAGLYNNALTGGMGSFFYREANMTPAEGTHILNELKRIDAPWDFDYINGRSIKCCLGEQAGTPVISYSRYWDYNDVPVKAVIALVRKGIYGRIPGRGILDCRNETAILSEALGINETNHPQLRAHEHASVADRLASGEISSALLEYILNEQGAAYVLAQRPSRAPKRYQISIPNHTPREVGHLVRPFSLRAHLEIVHGSTPENS